MNVVLFLVALAGFIGGVAAGMGKRPEWVAVILLAIFALLLSAPVFE